jgi:mediator of RNA polymerase II transcription subunit 14
MLKWIDDLNTLLAVRLNLDDFDKVPYHFRNYNIESGRVTFKVEGEFEVDLTIADEDFDKQFWFIDFRFAFSPAPSKLSDGLRAFLERRVNEELLKDGLSGCYRFLHEYVLTHKINELKRQANELNRSSWTETLVVEPLDRALAIQYWSNRYSAKAPKSWILLGVHSSKKQNGRKDEKSTSFLSLHWYRDGKEIKDVDLPFDATTLSAESLLKTVIARHVEHILSTIHGKLAPAPRFMKRESAMVLQISRTEPIESALIMQLGCDEDVTLRIEPVTGLVSMNPHTQNTLRGELSLNSGNVDPAEEGVPCLEIIRRQYILDQLNRRGKCLGWATTTNPLQPDDIKMMLKTRETPNTFCFQRQGWDQKWYVMMALSLSGDEWWLFSV